MLLLIYGRGLIEEGVYDRVGRVFDSRILFHCSTSELVVWRAHDQSEFYS